MDRYRAGLQGGCIEIGPAVSSFPGMVSTGRGGLSLSGRGADR